MSSPTEPTGYFAYGSNLNKADMLARCPDARPGIPARFEGWRLTFRGVADIEPAPGRTVHGALWWLGADDVCNLDRYEGAPSNYRQCLVEVGTTDVRLTAMTYVMTRRDYLGLPSSWYLGRIEAGFEDWELPRQELIRAVRETRAELTELGVASYSRDGRKRLRAVHSEVADVDRVRRGGLTPTH
ncbi:MAG: gamma-glutamylcyclotransferase family protein [Solirubrobacterales bacterium]